MAFSSAPRLYFAYGASLSISEMKSRCPTSTFYSIALLRNHRWFVNERGYANIVPSLPGADGTEDVVWGILYTLRPFDEELLDKHEGIPWAYSKADMDVEAVGITEDGRGTRREVVMALVYIDRERVQESYPWPEFMVKMNRGIQEAVERGLPTSWIEKVVRPYMMDPAAANGAEKGVEVEAVAPVEEGPRAPSVAKPESDCAGQIQETQAGSHSANGAPQSPTSTHFSQSHAPTDVVVGGHFVNGGSQRGRSNHASQPQGLEKSKYAREDRMSGVQQRKAAKERQAGGVPGKGAPPPTFQGQVNKSLECWWWKVKGSCRFSDAKCQYAHYETGVLAIAPGMAKKGPPPEKEKTPFQPKSVPRRERSPSFKPYAGKENENQPYGYKQDWNGKKQDRSGQQELPKQDKVEANASWSEQVENLMDSEPEWLVANDRRDVKW